MIKNIAFDFGGVIVDISRDNAVAEFVRMGLADAESRLDSYHQTGLFQELEEGKLSDEDFRRAMEELCHRPLTWNEVQRAWLGFVTGQDLNKLHFLEQLRKDGYKLYLLSNTNPFIMGWACSDEYTPEHKPLPYYFEKLYLSYQVGYTKPDREIFAYMLEDSALRPEETLFVDDGAANVAAAQALGMHTFQPRNASDWRSDLSELLKAVK